MTDSTTEPGHGTTIAEAVAIINDMKKHGPDLVAARPRCGHPVPFDAPPEYRGMTCTLATGHAHPNDHDTGRGYGLPSYSWHNRWAPAAVPAPVTCDGCGAVETPGDGRPIVASIVHADDCPHVLAAAREERSAREAPLVALVAAVPAWADPVAWRAAVLAVDDAANWCAPVHRVAIDAVWFERDTAWLRENHDRPCDLPEWTAKAVAHAAYRRALAPSAAVRPEWRERAPYGLTCNAHEVP